MSRSRLLGLVLVLALLHAPRLLAQVQLKLKPPEGRKYTSEISNLAVQTLTLGGMEIKTEADTSMVLGVDASKADDQGHIRQRTKFESLRSNLTLPGGNVTYDSKINLAKADVEQYNFLLDALRAMSGATFTVVVDTQNRFVGAEGLEDVLKPALPQANEMLKAQFNLDKLRKEHEQSLAKFPDTPVKVGDTWQRMETMDLGSGQQLKVERKFEYQGAVEHNGRTLDKIDTTILKVHGLDVDANSTLPFRFGKSDLKVMETKGTILFDRERGEELENTRLMHIKGPLTLVINGMDIPGEVDLRMENKVLVKD